MGLIFGVCILVVSFEVVEGFFTSQNLSSSSKSTPHNSAPKQTIVRYYQLATTNRQEAIKLLSDPWRRQAATQINDNWWNSIRRVEVYAFKTFAKNNSKAKIKVWLKYQMKNGQTPCESLIFNLIFDRSRNQWLMDSVEPNSVIQNPYCNSK
nr:hypothetical protein [Laspinema sp. D2d]